MSASSVISSSGATAEQVCIPVGCVPSAAVDVCGGRGWRVSPEGVCPGVSARGVSAQGVSALWGVSAQVVCLPDNSP